MKDTLGEIELKVVLDDAAEHRLLARMSALEVPNTDRNDRTVHSTYFDTSDHRLRAAGIAIRLRRDGRRYLQTVKSRAQLAGGLSRANETESEVPDGALDLSVIPDAALRESVDLAVGDNPLIPVFETVMRRSSYLLRADGESEVEVSIDAGEIRTDDRTAEFREAELELLRGEVSALYDLAKKLLPDGGLHLSTLSKADRGYLLVETGLIDPPLIPRNARDVSLDEGQTVESAARDVLAECLDQISANVLATCQLDDPEGPHQLRVGLRRLRTALSLFRPIIGCPALEVLRDEARWLGQEVGVVRDLDVALSDIVAPEMEHQPDEPGFGALREAIETRRQERRTNLCGLLRGARVQTFLIELSRFIETRAWLCQQDYTQTARLAQHLGVHARGALGKRWRKVRTRAKHIEILDVADRHDLRKELKKLRYAIEFLGPIYPQKKVRRLVKSLKRLQEVFGALNDLAMAEQLFMGPDAPCRDNPAAQRAIGRVLGARALRSEEDWTRARELWHGVQEVGPFWS
jgi:inorganic triphosphatase YgiF